jgi:hypothetical protein
MENDPYADIIKILQDNAKEEGIDSDLVKGIYDMEKLTLNSQTKTDEENLKQKIIKAMVAEDYKKIEDDTENHNPEEEEGEGMKK